MHCLLGENGAGKSTLCNLIFGVYAPSAGEMRFGDKAWLPPSPAEALDQGIAMVHQHFSLVPRMTVVENLMLGQARGVLNRQVFAARIGDIADRFGFVLDLSGGNQQKAVLGRELTLDPLVALVAAQPTRGLDVSAVEAVYRQIRTAARRGVGVLLISSELDELIAVADRIAVLYRGRLVGERPAEMDERGAIGALMSGQLSGQGV